MARRRRTLLWLAGAAAVVGVAAIAAAWSSTGAAVWTDGRAIRVAEDEASPRRVLWTPAERIAGTVNTDVDEYEPRVSADGTTMVLVRGRPGANADLFIARQTRQGWSEPTPLTDVNTGADELGPELSADGATLWFYSDRAGGFGGYDLWMATLVDGVWSTPINAGPALNTAFNEYGPALAPDGGRIYFSSNRPGPGEATATTPADAWSATLRERRVRRDYDLYVSRAEPGTLVGWGPTTPMAELNTSSDEGAPTVSPAGDFLYFASDRAEGAGGFDLYRARVDAGGPRPVERLESAINTSANELDPTLSADGFRLVFSSARDGRSEDLWTSVSREVYLERTPRPSIASLLRDAVMRFWPWLLLLALLLALLAAAWWLWRAGGWRRRFMAMSLLAQCLLISIVAHVLLAMLLATWHVREGIGQLLRGATETRVVLASGAPSDGWIARELREQLDERPSQSSPPDVSIAAARLRPEPAAHRVDDAPRPDPQALDRIVANIIDGRAAMLPRRLDGDEDHRHELDAAKRPAALAPTAMSDEATDADLPPMDLSPAALPAPSRPVIATLIEFRSASASAALDARRTELPVSLEGSMADAARPSAPEPVASSQETTLDAIVRGASAAPAAQAPPTSAPEFEVPAAPRSSLLREALDDRSRVELAAAEASFTEVARPAAPANAALSHDAPAEDTGDKSFAGAVSLPPAARMATTAPSIAAPIAPDDSALQAALNVRDVNALALSLAAHGVDSTDAAIPAPPAEANPPIPAESFEQRDPERREEILDRMGGGSDTEEAVGRALAWFARHQSADGRWSARGPWREGSPRSDHTDGDRCDCGDPAEVDMDVAATSLVLLCFLAAGHTHTDAGPYRDLVDRGVRWLMARQSPDGDLRRARRASGRGEEPPADTMYGHTIASVALCEASAMTHDAAVAEAARIAVAFVVAQASRPGGANSDDTSVLGWQVMAIESARRAGVTPAPGPTSATLRSARAWLDSISTGGRSAYRRAGAPSIAMTAEAMFVRQLVDQFEGRAPDAARLRESATFVLEAMPSWAAGAPTHHWYYATLALFQHQAIDEHAWTRWNEALKPELLAHQRRDGHASGSWDPHDEWSRLGGRIYQTAICTLSLEVYYRYRADGATPASP